MSHNAESHNVVLKITVPKRTGRKRRKGTNDPWQGDFEVEGAGGSQNAEICSHSRLDDPRKLKKQLEDNVGGADRPAVGERFGLGEGLRVAQRRTLVDPGEQG